MTAIRPFVLPRFKVLCASTAFTLLSLTGCAQPPSATRAKGPSPAEMAFEARREPPPRVLAVRLGRMTLRANAWMDLHTWVVGASRTSEVLPTADLELAKEDATRALQDDDRDRLLARTVRALAVCDDDDCAHRALTGTRFERHEGEALPWFLAHEWTARASAAHAAIDAVRAAGEVAEPLADRLAADLALQWPADAVLPIVADAPSPGRDALVPAALGAKGSCFMRRSQEELRLHHARIIDCALSHAIVPLGEDSKLAFALARELPGDDGVRAWELVVIHAVAATVTGLERRHVSVMRKSAYAEESEILDWLAAHWKERASGQSIELFATRFAEAWRTRKP